MAKHKSHGTTQFAALPWRISEGGTRQVMLLTSREAIGSNYEKWGTPVSNLKAEGLGLTITSGRTPA